MTGKSSSTQPQQPTGSRRTLNPTGAIEESFEYSTEAAKFNQDLINQWAANAVKDNSRLLELKKKVFPNWSPYIADIYNRIQTLPSGMNSPKITVDHLMLLYPAALVEDSSSGEPSKFIGSGGKQKAVKEVEKWLATQCVKKDLYEMQRYQQILIDQKINEAKESLRKEILPEIEFLKKEVKANKAKLIAQEARMDNNFTTMKEIVINAKECENWKKSWDSHNENPEGNHMEDLMDNIAIYLKPLIKDESFNPRSITYVEYIPSKEELLTRFVVRFATVNIQQEILHSIANRNTNDPTILKFQSEIRQSYSAAERKKRFEKFGPLQASCQYNYLAVTHPEKYKSYSRVEFNNETGQYHCKKYPKSDSRVKKAAKKARLGLITQPKKFKAEEHQVFLDPLLVD